MTYLRSPLIALILIGLIALPLAAAPVRSAALAATACAPTSGSGGISGQVTGPGNTPITNATITVFTAYGRQVTQVQSSTGGNYQVGNLIDGAYLLRFEVRQGATDLFPLWYPGTLDPTDATPVVVGGGAVTGGINQQLAAGVRFSGTVVAEDGGPLQSVQVQIYNSQGAVVASTFTAADGTYLTAPGVPSGAYRVRFAAPTGRPYLGEYFNGQDTLETATPLSVTAPDTRANVNATLTRAATISGRITDATSGAPLPNISVSISGAGGSDFMFTDADGRYTSRAGLRGGEYTVRAQPTFDSQNYIPGSRTVTVGEAASLTGVDIALEAGGTLTGIVREPDGTPVQSASVLVIGQNSGVQRFANTAADGAFVMNSLPSDAYALLVRRSGFINEYYNGKTSFSAADFVNVTAPQTTDPVEITLRRGSAISGVVTDAVTNTPIAGVFVEALNADGGRVESGFTNAAGEYTLSATLPSGAYFVRFNPDDRNASCAYITQYYNDQPGLEGATPITVTAPNPVTGIDAALRAGSQIFGRVTDATSDEPLANITVRVRNAAGASVAFGRTTFLGGYITSPALPSGEYTVEFSDNGQFGYIDAFYAGALSADEATRITLNAPTDRTGIDAALALGGRISGRVTAIDSGAGLPGVVVRVFAADGRHVATDFTDSDGQYRIDDGLPAGAYRIGFAPRRPSQGEGNLAQGGFTPAGYLPGFYRNGRTLGEADAVTVAAAALTENVDIALQRGVLLPLLGR
jgi:hypothetical protein